MHLSGVSLVLLLACSVKCAPPIVYPPPYQELTNYNNHYYDFYDISQDLDDSSGELKLEELEEALKEVLLSGDEDPPLVFIDDVPQPQPPSSPVFPQAPVKRSRYYRRYPGKRQTKYYDPDGYMCAPTRDDVYRLLVALHEARAGSSDKTIHFCNRKRPAKAVFTNIRFLGRRK